ncbi:hypothetical protein [Plantactinospora endophytica]|uniref:Excreted virulence factor EspC (Type VII ESX diderm) n=1 Tax=Plantactinospora endophytica TaxID=673535 RepID=A0ABQ4E4I4_9ACTN|nr:hypothetical protein [Plantactinospora endophytica]GIG89598.1 hypothetical protein Pen02_45340 [Plantactinospora endophytica]
MQPQPDAGQVKMARETLVKDAAKWAEAASVMEAAATRASSLMLTGFHIGYLPNQQGVGAKYAELQEFVVNLLADGARTMRDMEQTLRTVLDNYDRSDQGAVVRIEQTWSPT